MVSLQIRIISDDWSWGLLFWWLLLTALLLLLCMYFDVFAWGAGAIIELGCLFNAYVDILNLFRWLAVILCTRIVVTRVCSTIANFISSKSALCPQWFISIGQQFATYTASHSIGCAALNGLLLIRRDSLCRLITLASGWKHVAASLSHAEWLASGTLRLHILIAHTLLLGGSPVVRFSLCLHLV